MRRFVTALTAAAVVAVPVTASHAADPAPCRVIRGADTADTADDVQVCRQDVWFQVAQPTSKVGNLAASDQTPFPTWVTAKPGGAGDGAVYAGTSAFHQLVAPWDPRGTAIFEGTYTGEIDTLAVSFYVVAPGKMQEADKTLATNTRLVVDGGEPIHENGGGVEVNLTPTATPGVKRLDFALVNVHSALAAVGKSGPGKHNIQLSVVGTGLATAGAVFLFDRADVPSGMVFNIEPDKLAGYTVLDLAPTPTEG